MRLRSLLMLLLSLLLSGRGLALAQAPQAEAESLFRNLDTNKDGKLSSDDTTNGNQRMLEQVLEMGGKPSGGSLTRAEFQQVYDRHRNQRGPAGGRPPMPPELAPREGAEGLPPLLRDLDSNGDGRLTRAELNRLSQIFERLDVNRDQSLDVNELRTLNEQPRGARPEPAVERNPAPGRSADSTPARSGGRSATEGSTGLAGVWRGWIVEGRGENPNAGQMEVELTVQGNRITGRELGTRRAPEGLGAGTYELTAGESGRRSGTLDADGTAGPQDGRHYLGIYELDGDTLRWCVTARRQRPQAMATDRGNYLLILRRQRD